MRTLLLIAALVVLLAAAIFLGGPADRMRQERKEADTRLCITHLKRIGGDIDEALLRDPSIDVATAITRIADKEGYGFLRCRPNTNEWVNINPSTHFWTSQVAPAGEIRLYCRKPGSTNLWLAQPFAASPEITLSNPPLWSPLPLPPRANAP